MVDYIETYRIPTGTHTTLYGIEDYEAPGDHFFPHEYAKGECKRFRLWRWGSGFGQAKTLKEARKRLYDYAVANLKADIARFEAELVGSSGALDMLREGIGGLAAFSAVKEH